MKIHETTTITISRLRRPSKPFELTAVISESRIGMATSTQTLAKCHAITQPHAYLTSTPQSALDLNTIFVLDTATSDRDRGCS